jgi:hypothetical protein
MAPPTLTLTNLTDALLTPGRVVFAYSDQTYAADVCALAPSLGLVAVSTSMGGGWLRDEVLITQTTDDAPTTTLHAPRLPPASTRRRAKSTLLAQWERIGSASDRAFMAQVSGTIGGAALFDDDCIDIANDDKYCIMRDGLLLEGGNVLVDGENIFIGEESAQLYSLMASPSPSNTLADAIPDKQCHLVPQFMWHLDLFVCIIAHSNATRTLLIPELDERRMDAAYMTPEKRRFLRILSASAHKLARTRQMFEALGYRVETLDAFFVERDDSTRTHKGTAAKSTPRMTGAYLNALAGTDARGAPYIVLPSFRYNAYIERQLRAIVDPGTGIHFVGDARVNARELALHGGALRCATAH